MSEIQFGTGMPDSLIKDTDTNSFMADVIEESKTQPVLVDFWAPWCGPCKQLTPIIEKAVTQAAGRVKLVKMNIDENPEIPGQMGVKSIPAVVAFKDGRPLDGFMGAVPESQINEFIDKISGPGAPSKTDLHLEEAVTLLESENFQEAAGHFSTVMQLDPTNVKAITGLAQCALGLGDNEQAREILAMVPQEQKNDPDFKAVEAQIDLLEKAADTGEIDTLQAKVQAAPDDHQARFDLAIALNAAGKRQDAATCLLEIVEQDRSWNDDGARKELLTFFEAWGFKDEVTQTARRKLSSLLFS